MPLTTPPSRTVRHEDGAGRARSDVTVVTFGDARFFPGVVALVNSLHLSGNGAVGVTVVDGGFTDAQRALLAPHATLVPLSAEGVAGTVFVKTELAALDLSGVVVVVDADCLVTAPLDELVAQAAQGRISVPRDDWPVGHVRRFPAWSDLFGLRAPLREGQDYANAGFMCLSVDVWPELLDRWIGLTRRLPPGPYMIGDPTLNAIYAADQDALNALLMSEVPADAVSILPDGAMTYAQWRGVDVVDVDRLVVTARGARALVVHFSLRPKPWQPGGWRRIGLEPVLPLLRRCLVGEDLAIRLDPASLPAWLASSASGTPAWRVLGGANRVVARSAALAWDAYGRLPADSRARLRRLRGRTVASASDVATSDDGARGRSRV